MKKLYSLAAALAASACAGSADDAAPPSPLGSDTAALVATGQQCWVIDDGSDRLHLVSRNDASPATNKTVIGALGVTNVEALAFDPLSGTIYAANGGQLGRVNNDTGVFTPLPQAMGTGNGAAGTITFNDADGLTIDPFTGFLYAAQRRNTADDVLFRVDLTTGARVADAFGAGVDYVVMPAVSGLGDIDDLAIDPSDGQMYGIANNGGVGDRTVRIDKATGAATDVGALGVADMEGFGYDAAGTLWGTTGSGVLGLYEINKATGAATLRAPFNAAGTDYEAVDCFTVPSTDVAVTATPSVARPNPGDTLTYTVVVTNDGPHAATAVTAAFPLPAGVTYASHTLTGGTSYTPGTGAIAVGNLAVGATVTLVVTVTVDGATVRGSTIAAPATVAVPTASLDPRLANNTATASVTINRLPTATADATTVAEDSAATVVNVLANDSTAPDTGETLTVTAVTQPASGGTVTLTGGVVRFTPATNFTGTTTFTYTVSDGSGGTASATVTVTVTPVNDPPTANDDAVTVAEDSAATVVNVLANDSTAPDTGETLTVTAVTQPATGGTVTLTGGVVRFTPAPNFNGTTTFTYTVSDGNGGTATATVTVTVTPVNDPPTAAADAVTVAEDSGATVVNVLANDSSGPDTGETLTVTAVTQPATGGTVTLTGGVVSFTPATNFNGTTTFTYTVSDGNGGTATATVTVTVTPVNDPPTATADAVTVAEDSGATVVNVLGNDSSAPDTGETLTVTSVTQPASGGTVTLTGGVVSFTPAPSFNGTTTFTYTVSDGNGGTATATVTVTVTPVNDPPTANDDSFTVAGNGPATTLDVLANDSTAPDTGETLTVSAVTQPTSGGTVTVTGGAVSFTPATGFTGTTTFTYTASDGNGGTATATVTVTVTQPDRDGDGLSDADEVAIGTDPDDADSDDDGVVDGDEPRPDADTDGDGLIDALDPDSDNDGLYDGTELGVTTPSAGTDVGAGHFVPDAEPSTTTDPLDADTDDGGVRDGAEDTDHDGQIDPGELDPNDPADDAVTPTDSDGDGVSDAEEAAIGTDPNDADSDDDGVTDGAEANFADDTDGDGLINALDPDSDNDGLYDGTELGVTTPDADTDVGAGHFTPDADPSTTTSMVDPDTDGGGVRDGAEDPDHDGRIDAGERDPDDPADDATAPTDTDGDGLTDAEEAAIGTDPDDADSDDDGVTDGAEANFADDTDGDGLINALDPDSDNDGLYDGTELGVTTPGADTDVGAGHFTPDADPSTTTSMVNPDTDGGGVRDGAEDPDHDGQIDPGERDPGDPADDATPPTDTDGDGLSDAEEAAIGTDPDDADSDDDGVIDGAEANFADDTDGDGLINALDPDSDSDGLYDGTELGVTTPSADTDVGAGHFTPDADPSTTTSMVDPDTDGGGVSDGDEDSDHDGQVEAGERDPLDPRDDDDSDRDGDGVLDLVDNCPDDANPDQADDDRDGDGDVCDLDDDGDGFEDGYGVAGGGCSTSGGGGGLATLALTLAVGAVVARRRRRAVAAVAAAAGVAAVAPVAVAQVASEKRDFSVERFELAGDAGGLLGVDGAGLTQPWDWDVHLWLGTANDPLVVYRDDGDGRERVGSLVAQRTGGELGASVVLHERLGLGLDVPLIVAQRRDDMVPGVIGTLSDVGGIGLGDLRVSPKIRLLRQAREGLDLALIPTLVLPTAGGSDYRGDDSVTFTPSIALSRDHGRVRWAIDLGYAFRRQTSVGNLTVDDELRARAGVGVEVTPQVELALTASTATASDDPFGDFARNHVELIAGPDVTLARRWHLFAAGGVGLRDGYGTPDWRALGGLRFANRTDAATDWDLDGLVATDRCPRDPEDLDGFADDDGCPDPDNDGDGVLDVNDGAPLDPEDPDGFEDADGVPDPDNDQDGILDGDDACPVVAENANGWQDDDGCPDVKDSDGDGVGDNEDLCPTDPEDRDGFADDDGCPEDNDGDGIADAADRCPTEPGPADNQGCPDLDRDGDTVVDRLDNCPDVKGTVANHGCVEKQLAVLTNGKIEILDVVYFKTNKDVIQARSFKLLASVANIIRNHPELTSIEIEGHTDDRGDDAYNLDLSQRRAEAVRTFLVGKGVEGARLKATGYGETRPLVPNDTNKHRSTNRRVEFKVGDVASANTGPTTDTMDRGPGDLP